MGKSTINFTYQLENTVYENSFRLSILTLDDIGFVFNNMEYGFIKGAM